MPELPRYQQKGTLPDRSPVQSRTSVEAASAVSRATADLAGKVQAGVEHFAKLEMANQETDAKVRAAEQLALMEESIKTEPELWDQKKVSDRLNEIETNSSNGLTFQEGKDAFKRDFGLTKIQAQVGANSMLRDYQINKRKVNQELEVQSIYGTYTGPEREVAVDVTLAKSLELGLYQNADAVRAEKIRIMKDYEERDIDNVAEVNPEKAMEMVDELTYMNQNEKKALREKVAGMKPLVDYKRQMFEQRRQAEASNELHRMDQEQEGGLTTRDIKVYQQTHPWLDDSVYKAALERAASKERLTGVSQGRSYTEILTDFVAIASKKLGGKQITTGNLSVGKFDPEQYAAILKLKAELMKRNADGEIVGDEYKTLMDFMNHSTVENAKFAQNYSGYATALETLRKWSSVTAAKLGSARVRVGSGREVTADDLLMASFQDFLKITTKKGDKLQDLSKMFGGTTPEELDKSLKSVLSAYNRTIAKQRQNITTQVSADGKERDFLTQGGLMWEVEGYENGSALVDPKKAARNSNPLS